jgi:hemolysin III
MSTTTRYTPAEELANAITHGVGVLVSIGGLGVLTGFAGALGDAWHIVSVSIYAASQILLYTFSTLYHAISQPRLKAIFRLLDHSAIFLLIAGTYTPFTLVNLRGPWGWSIFGLVWGLALAGILAQGLLIKRAKWVNAALYIAMGWLCIIGIRPMLLSVAPGGLILLLIGGLAYTIGTVFYVWQKLPFHHAIWHGFVLVGSLFHFFAILFYVIPLA